MKKSIIKKIFLAVFTMFLCLALTSAGCDTISNPSKSPSRPTNPGTTPPVDDDDLDLEGALDSVNEPATGIKFIQSNFKVLASTTPIDLRNWVVPVPSNYKLPEITFELSGNTDMSARGTVINDNNLIPGSSSPQSWTLTAKPKNGTAVTATLEVVDIRPFSPESDDSVTAASLVGKTYVTRNRVGNDTSPWYAIHFFSATELGIGKCSIVRPNAIKLARKGSGVSGSSTGQKVKYTYNDSTKVFTMQGSVNIIGGDFVINGNKLINMFLVNPTTFEEVPAGKNDL